MVAPGGMGQTRQSQCSHFCWSNVRGQTFSPRSGKPRPESSPSSDRFCNCTDSTFEQEYKRFIDSHPASGRHNGQKEKMAAELPRFLCSPQSQTLPFSLPCPRPIEKHIHVIEHICLRGVVVSTWPFATRAASWPMTRYEMTASRLEPRKGEKKK